MITMLYNAFGVRAYLLASRWLDGDRQGAESVVRAVFVEISRALSGLEDPDPRGLSRRLGASLSSDMRLTAL